jgi:prenyltransferase beta subunit
MEHIKVIVPISSTCIAWSTKTAYLLRCSLACLALLHAGALAHGQTAEQKASTLAYVTSLQRPDGGFAAGRERTGKTSMSSLRATLSAVRVMNYLGGELPRPADCGKFVAGCFDKQSGGFGDRPGGNPDALTTAIGIMALVDLKMPVDGYREPALTYLAEHARSFEEIRLGAAAVEALHVKPAAVSAWIQQLRAMRNADGTFGTGNGQARETASAAVALLRLGDTVSNAETVLRILKSGQRADGSFGKKDVRTSGLETSYRVMRAFYMLRAMPNTAAMKEFIAQCRTEVTA